MKQAQSMQKKMKSLMKGLVAMEPMRWPDVLPLVQFSLRITPREVLTGRSSMEVVTGMKLVLPQHLFAEGYVEAQDPEEHVNNS